MDRNIAETLHARQVSTVQGAMEIYTSQSKNVINRFLCGSLSFPDCIEALDAAQASLMPRLTSDQIVALRVLMLANNEIVMKELERRGPPAATVLSSLPTLELHTNLEV